MENFDFEKFCRESDERQRQWDALPEKEKQRQRWLLAGWADRIEAENEALGLQFEEELKKMSPQELRDREERVNAALRKLKENRRQKENKGPV